MEVSISLNSSFASVSWFLKGPIHDSDLQSQPQFPTATSTKFPVYGLQQPQPPPQLAGRCCGCCWSEFSDIWWAIWSSEARSDIVTIRELRFNWERLNRSVAACVGRPSTATATAIWPHIAVAIENRCRGWGPLGFHSQVEQRPTWFSPSDCYSANLLVSSWTL